MNLATLVTEDRRRAVLSILTASAGYEAGATLLQTVLGTVGHHASLDTVTADLAWLRDAGLVELKQAGDIWLATLTPRGLDVAADRTHVPGVARPGP